ncbi:MULTISPECIES: malic enzyme-like protein [Parafrankia]|uniref:malic enzyme-like protein n=1 Tax=Parafrankia TaxID=2994362 RepID=UPI0013F4E4D6|nr:MULTISPECIES: malic enzyme-like protein [Parafrankia]MBE3200206.1 malic enzyme-like protein [Parafrankia sp. CH37]
MTSRGSARVNPAFGLAVYVSAQARPALETVLARAPGMVVVQTDDPGPDSCRRITVDADSGSTPLWLVHALQETLGSELLHTEDPVFAVASTGKLGQSLRASIATGRDLALLDVDADRRVVRHLSTHPGQTDRFSGRTRRVALLSDASAVLDFEPLPAGASLPAVESQAVHLHRETGFDVVPIPITVDGPDELASAIRMIDAGFGASVLVHTHVRHIDAVRAALRPGPAPHPVLLDTINDGFAVAAAAAALNHLRLRDIGPGQARVAVVDPHRGGDLAGLLLAAGIGDLMLYDPVIYGVQLLHQLADRLDLIVDLIGLAAPPVGPAVLRARPEAPPRLTQATMQPRPLHALPGLLRAAVTARRSITMAARVAAVHAVAEQAPFGALLPRPDHPHLVSAVSDAALSVLSTP